MATKNRNDQKNEFLNGLIPDQDDFGDIIDSSFNKLEDGVYAYTAPDSTKRFGIGTTTPGGPLGILQNPANKFISFHAPDNTVVWDIDRPSNTTRAGWSITERTPSGDISRLFVQETDGHVGIGTIQPTDYILELNELKADAAAGLKVMNTASLHTGWAVTHISNGSVAAQDGAFGIYEQQVSPAAAIARMVILSGGNVGINELLPDTKLHVSRTPGDPNLPVGLVEHTGIAEFGLVNSTNIVFDDKGIQARVGSYPGGGSALQLDPSQLELQNLGGKILIHGKSSIPDSQKILIDDHANTGIGILTPAEKLHVNGRVIVGDSTNTAVAGAIRWTGTDFEGFNGTVWKSLTDNGGATSFWTAAGTDKITYNATNAKVGIGVQTPATALDVADNTDVTASSLAARIINTAVTTSMDVNSGRAGLQIQCTGTFNPNQDHAKNMGLVVSNISGSVAEACMAAVLNGNVVIGGITTDSDMVGQDGNRVLVMQKGAAPQTAVPGTSGTASDAIQIYSDQVGPADTTCVFHVMNSDGHVVKLYKQSALPDRDESAITDTWTTVEEGVLNNVRSRLDALEAKLVNLGLFDSSSVLP